MKLVMLKGRKPKGEGAISPSGNFKKVGKKWIYIGKDKKAGKVAEKESTKGFKPRISIRESEYRDKKGFSISGRTQEGGFPIRIFTESKDQAQRIKWALLNIKDRKEASAEVDKILKEGLGEKVKAEKPKPEQIYLGQQQQSSKPKKELTDEEIVLALEKKIERTKFFLESDKDMISQWEGELKEKGFLSEGVEMSLWKKKLSISEGEKNLEGLKTTLERFKASMARIKEVQTFIPGKEAKGFSSWKDHPTTVAEWNKVEGQADIKESELKVGAGLKAASGVVIQEKDGRIWVVSPAKGFGGYKNTFPKGKLDEGLSLQANAIKEAYEESGLKVKIVKHLVDIDKTTSTTRYYLAERVGGSPSDAGWESEAVKLVPKDKLKELLNQSIDHKVVDAMEEIKKSRRGFLAILLKGRKPAPAGTIKVYPSGLVYRKKAAGGWEYVGKLGSKGASTAIEEAKAKGIPVEYLAEKQKQAEGALEQKQKEKADKKAAKSKEKQSVDTPKKKRGRPKKEKPITEGATTGVGKESVSGGSEPSGGSFSRIDPRELQKEEGWKEHTEKYKSYREQGIYLSREEETQFSKNNYIPEEQSRVLMEHQRDFINLAMDRFEIENDRGMLNMDGTGGGKTLQELVLADIYHKKHPDEIVLITTQNWDLVENAFGKASKQVGVPFKVVKDAKEITGPGIYVTAYSVMSRAKGFKYLNVGLALFDECQNLKREGSSKTKTGMRIISEAKHVGLFSATPIDKAEFVHYVCEVMNLNFYKVMNDAGYKQQKFKIPSKFGMVEIKVWERLPGVTAKMAADSISKVFTELTKKGKAVKREVSLKNLHLNLEYLKLNSEQQQKYAIAEKFFVEETERNPKAKGYLLMGLRRLVEEFKIDKTIQIVKDKLAKGEQVAIFSDRVNETAVQIGWRMETAMGDFGPIAKLVREKTPVGATNEMLQKKLKEAGIMFSVLTGTTPKKTRQEEIAKFQKGSVKVFLTTPGSGGVGINLDDTKGNAPRHMVIMTPQFSAMEFTQTIGRVNRLTTKSPARCTILTTDTMVDSWNKDIIANKVAILGGAVQGDYAKISFEDLEDTVHMSEGEAKQYLAEKYGSQKKTATVGGIVDYSTAGEVTKAIVEYRKPILTMGLIELEKGKKPVPIGSLKKHPGGIISQKKAMGKWGYYGKVSQAKVADAWAEYESSPDTWIYKEQLKLAGKLPSGELYNPIWEIEKTGGVVKVGNDYYVQMKGGMKWTKVEWSTASPEENELKKKIYLSAWQKVGGTIEESATVPIGDIKQKKVEAAVEQILGDKEAKANKVSALHQLTETYGSQYASYTAFALVPTEATEGVIEYNAYAYDKAHPKGMFIGLYKESDIKEVGKVANLIAMMKEAGISQIDKKAEVLPNAEEDEPKDEKQIALDELSALGLENVEAYFINGLGDLWFFNKEHTEGAKIALATSPFGAQVLALFVKAGIPDFSVQQVDKEAKKVEKVEENQSLSYTIEKGSFKVYQVKEVEAISNLGGTTGGGVKRATITFSNGQKREVAWKTGNTEDHLRNEFVADSIYELFGAETKGGTLVRNEQGELAVVSAYNKDLVQGGFDSAIANVIKMHLKHHFVLDALLGNWDVTGATMDNVLFNNKTGKVVRIDNGGALLYRAQGEGKGDKFGNEVPELETMRDPTKLAGKVFSTVTDGMVLEQIKAIVAKKHEIMDLCAGIPGLKEKIGERIHYLKHWQPKAKEGESQSVVSTVVRKYTTDGIPIPNEEEKGAILHYKGNGYSPINEALRDYTTTAFISEQSGSDVVKKIGYMDRFYKDIPIKNLKVMRGMKKAAMRKLFEGLQFPKFDLRHNKTESTKAPDGTTWKEFFTSWFKGMKIADNGFISTSTSESTAWGFAEGEGIVSTSPKVIIKAIGKAKGYSIAEVQGSDSEYEVLLNRGTVFEIKSVEFGNNAIVFNAKLITIGAEQEAVEGEVQNE